MGWALWRRRSEPPPAAEASRPRDWERLPPIQRTIGPAPETGGGTRFVRGLAGSSPPELALQQLGHQVSAEAPPGLIVVGRQAESYAAASEMVSAPRPPRRPGWQGWLGRLAGAPEPAPEPAAEAAVTEPEGAGEALAASPAAPAGTQVASGEPASPPRRLEAITEPPPSLPPLTVARVEAPGGGTRADAAGAGEPAAGPAEPSGAAPVASGLELGAQMPASPAVSRLTLGQSRRLGLGPPIRRSEAAEVQRSRESRAPSLPPAVAPLRATEPSGPADLPSEIEVELAEASGPVAGASTPPSDRDLRSGPQSGAAPQSGLGLPLQRSRGRRERPAEAPPAGDRPEPLPPADTSAAGAPIPEPPPAAELGQIPSPEASAGERPAQVLPLQRRWAPAEEHVTTALPLTAGPELRPQAGGEGARSPVAVVPLAGWQPMAGTSSRAGRANQPAGHSLQRATSGAAADTAAGARLEPPWEELPPPALPLQPGPALGAFEVQPGPTEAAGLESVASPDSGAGLALARPRVGPTASYGSSLTSPVLQREVAPSPGASLPAVGIESMPALQRQVEAEPAAAAPAQAGSGAAGPGGHSEQELDDLARQLYDRFRVHLRSELLIDRERVGMLMDRR